MADDSGSSFLAGLITGLLLGAGLGLLLAPRPGEATRAQLREKALELEERAKEAAARARERAEELAERGRQAVEEGREAAQRAREEFASTFQPPAQEGPAPS